MLSPLSWIYGKIADIRNARYDSGRSPVSELGARTISIGNITAGGTGKTPLVIKTAELLAARGKRVCILTRGYGRANPKKQVVVSNGKEILTSVRDAGDEALEIAKKLLGKAIVVADADRIAAGKWAKEEFGITTFVLDDGFQHRRVKRDVDIVCIDATDPLSGSKMLPSGRLRERLVNLRRATAIVITRANIAPNIRELKSEIAKYVSGIPVFTASAKMTKMTYLPTYLANADSKDRNNLDHVVDFSTLANAKAYAFCALGNPKVFFDQLGLDNFDIAGTKTFADHHWYKQAEITALAKAAGNIGAAFFLTTAKDAVKLAGLNVSLPCFVVEIALTIDNETAFSAIL